MKKLSLALSCLLVAVVAVMGCYMLTDLFGALAFAQATLPEIPAEPTFSYSIAQFVELFKNWSLLSVQMKVASVLVILVGLVKNSALSPLFDKLGKFKALVAPLLMLIAAFMYVQPFTLATAIAAITTGVAAGYFHQVLDMVKAIPGLGPVYVKIIEFIGGYLGAPKK
jgi:hypothetical protein